MKKALRGMAQEISHSLVRELGTQRAVKKPSADGIVDLLLQRLAEEVGRQLEADSKEIEPARDLETRLRMIETALQELATTDGDDEDEDEVEGSGSSFPNLKYAKPKYKDVESVLKYIESDEDKGGVKLVIMNFND